MYTQPSRVLHLGTLVSEGAHNSESPLTGNVAYPCIQTILKTYHLHKQTTNLCAYECAFSMATTEEGCPVEGGARTARIRDGRIKEG